LKINEFYKRVISGTLYVIILWSATSYSELTFSVLFALIGIICTYEMWQLRKDQSKLIAFSYVIVPFIIIQFFGLSDHNYSEFKFDSSPILVLFIMTWIFDTFAYIVGSKIGKNKILPKISPKKSWEGFIGGYIFTLLSVYFINQYFECFTLNFLILLALIIPFTASAGDFIASYYKRIANVKDSGIIIPGHGGMLDRMDAFMISIPVLYILINLLNENS
tara:strand:- start:708 stop:1367 length:660 start_codon:yes stop_codon:yes gene_type:complete